MAIDRGEKDQPANIEELLDELTAKIERLRALYEQYFMGMEKLEPHTPRKDVGRKLLELQQVQIRNTGLRYRFNMLMQKFNVFQTYWNRTTRAIDNGTYYRDVARVGRTALATGADIPEELLRSLPPRMRDKIQKERAKAAAQASSQARVESASGTAPAAKDAGLGPAKAASMAATGTSPGRTPGRAQALADDDHDIDSALDNLFGDALSAVAKVSAPPAAPPRAAPLAPGGAPRSVGPAPARAAAPAPGPVPARAAMPAPVRTVPPAGAASLPGGVDEQIARELHKRFVQAKKLVGEAADHIKLEHIVATIAKQTPAIMKQHNAKSVDFEVVVKDNKVILKATPKK